jgi:trans-2,3-dihydro-3-hydroxyanthranilate isomerase
VDVKHSRRSFLQSVSAAGLGAAVGRVGTADAQTNPNDGLRRFHFVQIDVFTSRRLEGNPLAVFTDARGLSDSEMQDLARETNLQETTFVFPRDAATEREQGVKVRIFVPELEIPFGGHPTLGTAMVLRNLRLASQSGAAKTADTDAITLDLKVGKVPVTFRREASGEVFGEMRQVDPTFLAVHDRETIASLLDLSPGDISSDAPIQTVTTGLFFIIVPIQRLSTLQRLTVAPKKAYDYMSRQKLPPGLADFYYITRDTSDPSIGLRTRGLFQTSEDPATGSASGCTAAWMVRYGIAQPEQTVHILQGMEIKRPSHIFVRASKEGDTVKNVRVGGHAVQIMEGTFSL